MIKSVIIEDEEKGRELLSNLLKNYCPNIQLLDMADSVKSGLASIKKHNPDLIFLDIIMPDESGFELLEHIKDMDVEVIFTTAYDQYAIKAIRFSAMDYLLKPIDVAELQNALKKVEEKLAGKMHDQKINESLKIFLENVHTHPHNMKLGLPTQSGINFVTIDNILFCKAEGNYSLIHFKDNNNQEIVTRTLKDLEELLTEFNFCRLHRSYLINLNHIKEYKRINHSPDIDGDGGCVIMVNDFKIPVSRDKRKVLLTKFARPF
ncbi:MAG: LytTR family DNA-binding domain-containing protein [Calditrichaceae bacterium]|jgi:two-component system LytT family response regulator